jgi:hypothetical protein
VLQKCFRTFSELLDRGEVCNDKIVLFSRHCFTPLGLVPLPSLALKKTGL